MLNRILSNDYPRSKLLAALLMAVLLGLAFSPFIFPGVKALSVAAKVLVFKLHTISISVSARWARFSVHNRNRCSGRTTRRHIVGNVYFCESHVRCARTTLRGKAGPSCRGECDVEHETTL